jgi:putative transposase
MDSHMRTELVVDALEMALWRRKPSAGLVHHSDRGAQYTAISFGRRLEEVDIVPSMGRTGTALDNAMAESFIATLKTELVHRRRFPDREVARSAIFEYLEALTNRPSPAILQASWFSKSHVRSGGCRRWLQS